MRTWDSPGYDGKAMAVTEAPIQAEDTMIHLQMTPPNPWTNDCFQQSS